MNSRTKIPANRLGCIHAENMAGPYSREIRRFPGIPDTQSLRSRVKRFLDRVGVNWRRNCDASSLFHTLVASWMGLGWDSQPESRRAWLPNNRKGLPGGINRRKTPPRKAPGPYLIHQPCSRRLNTINPESFIKLDEYRAEYATI